MLSCRRLLLEQGRLLVSRKRLFACGTSCYHLPRVLSRSLHKIVVTSLGPSQIKQFAAGIMENTIPTVKIYHNMSLLMLKSIIYDHLLLMVYDIRLLGYSFPVVYSHCRMKKLYTLYSPARGNLSWDCFVLSI